MKTSTVTQKNSSATPKKIGRPINCFLAFRLEKHREISSQSPGLNHRVISKIVAKWWREASEIEKAPYRAIAQKAKAEHAEKYPNYKYKPIKKSERKVRAYHRREDVLTRERKSNAQKQLLKQWLGDDDDEEEEEGDDASTSTSSSSNSSQSFFFVNMPFIKQEPMPGNVDLVSSTSTTMCPPPPVFYDNLHYDFDTKPLDMTFIEPDCVLSQVNAVKVVPDISSSLDFFHSTPDYVNLQMLTLNDSPFML